ncbi:TetR/AcrR family transcriptional regulator [Nocardia goodfellowii]|uniref:AcrR family transcriptional regulator n=1 Tax=Nocardia goodfellowii TaxID=882446 RepID=A0ABS4QK86_9NOCA|nr:TetR/AcrR family transcriptional regulator [Nocardia goodfellowii]MBP2192127.1 AcrR family transcriptional regulator [Nocardia goodfellowii]
MSAPRGRIDKQQAVLTAAFTVFARSGYAQARVDEIAAEAQVAKATVYNHFGDKETLFRQVVQALSDTALAANLAAVEHLVDNDDLPATLREVGFQLARCYCAEESRVLRRLVAAEAAQFPDLLDIVGAVPRRVTQALADRLARLALAGSLHIDDPEMAATQFTALLTGGLDSRSRLGTRAVPDTEIRTGTDAAAATFLKAFGGANHS